MPGAQQVTTPSTRSRRVMCSRTSVSSWSTSIRPRPRRPVPRSSLTRWRLAASRTRRVTTIYVLHTIITHFYFLFPQLLGRPPAPCRPCYREAVSYHCCGTRIRQGVNIHQYIVVDVLPLSAPLPCCPQFALPAQVLRPPHISSLVPQLCFASTFPDQTRRCILCHACSLTSQSIRQAAPCSHVVYFLSSCISPCEVC